MARQDKRKKKRKQLPPSLTTNLQNVEAHVGPQGAVVRIRLLVRVHVEQADRLVGLQAALVKEDQQRARPADLQVPRKQVGDGLADQRAGGSVPLRVAQLQGPGAQLHAHVHSFTPQLSTHRMILSSG